MARSYKMTKLILDSLIGDTSTLVLDQVNHRVGIGTASPNLPLSVSGSMEIGMGLTGYIRNYNSTRSQNGFIKLYDVGTGSVELGTTSSAGDIVLTPGPAGSVGIGVAAPVGMLQIGSVVGTAKDNFIHMGVEGGDIGYYSSGLKLRTHTDNYGFDVLSVNNVDASLAGLNIVRHENSAEGVSALFIRRDTGDVTIAANLNVSGTYVTLPGGCRDWGKRAAAPTSPAPVEGDRFWNTTTHAISYYNGSTWS